ncbi:PREDICTED: general odorant-binding protein 71 isoform X2 [Wasmannia auropunctata]|uniref:general odorant-binding protein 71 isoform X2 n=1 Tax=Wasmannia auropunctata TaxID=64793 RepID=UPI0005EEA4BD|nr:PREDICTED: general odorant-binding protein 71 isoform X2 [Wasmannia auropunctata]
MMTRVILIVLCSLCLLLIESANSLKCRTGVQQANDQYRKIIQICKKRSMTDNDYSNNDSSNEDDDDDSLSVDLFGTKFLMNGGSKYSNMQSWKDPYENRNHGNNQKNNDRRYSVNYTNGNWRNIQYSSRGNNRDFSYSDGVGRPSYDPMYNGNSENYDKQQCITQCFFNELNMVDQRGFPEQISIIQFMTRNIHNPELQDFIEEAIIECFHYLDSDVRQDKCYFSENLLICLIEKGKERCEDWDD